MFPGITHWFLYVFSDRVNQWKFTWPICFRLPILYSRSSQGLFSRGGVAFFHFYVARPARAAISARCVRCQARRVHVRFGEEIMQQP